MRKLIILGLMAAVAAPSAATAQSRGEIRRDRQELREEQRELRQARRFGDRSDIRHERRDVRAARRELREDRADRRAWRRDDWRSYRTINRPLFSRGYWRAPFAYRTFRPGFSISASFYSPRYVISNPHHYRLPPAYGYQRWVRHYDDLLLVDIRRGIVLDVIRNFYW